MIGIFDSGLGGLTALAELRRYRPDLDIVYYADTAHLPYGTRSPAEIIRLATNAISFLYSRGADAVLVACGTVSSVALPHIAKQFSIPLIGVIEPAAQLALSYTKTNIIGVIATTATIESHAFETVLHARGRVATLSAACPLFVSLVENGFTALHDPVATPAIAHYLAPLRARGMDTLILGCTHFPHLAAGIAAYLPRVRLIGAGEAAADAIISAKPRVGRGDTEIWVSDAPAAFTTSAARLLGQDLPVTVKKKV